jgi:hypothetical protein
VPDILEVIPGVVGIIEVERTGVDIIEVSEVETILSTNENVNGAQVVEVNGVDTVLTTEDVVNVVVGRDDVHLIEAGNVETVLDTEEVINLLSVGLGAQGLPGIQGVRGDTGAQGPQGPPGDAGSGVDSNYVHLQNLPATSWVIVHGLAKFPSVTVVDSAGSIVEGDIHYVDTNSLTVSFSVGFSGKAYLN